MYDICALVEAEAVMYSAPIFLELDPIRSNEEKLDLDPIQIHKFPFGSRSDPDPIRSGSPLIRSNRICPNLQIYSIGT